MTECHDREREEEEEKNKQKKDFAVVDVRVGKKECLDAILNVRVPNECNGAMLVLIFECVGLIYLAGRVLGSPVQIDQPPTKLWRLKLARL